MKQGELFDPARPPEPPEPPGPQAPTAPPADHEARAVAVTCTDVPVLLQAGAGTGKTATLVARIAQWSLGAGWARAQSEHPDEDDRERTAGRVLAGVTAITFTEAAAAEMSTRVGEAFTAVAEACRGERISESGLPPGLVTAELPEDAGVLRARARALRASIDHLQVSTIHAFCRRVLASHPLEAGLDPRFEVDATFTQAEIVVRESIEEWLRAAWAEPVDVDLLALARAGVDPPQIEAAVLALMDSGARAADFAEDPLDRDECAQLLEGLGESLVATARSADALARVPKNQKTHDALAAMTETVAWIERAAGAPDGFAQLCAALSTVWTERAWSKLDEWRSAGPNATETKKLGDAAGEFRAAATRLAESVEPLRGLDLDVLHHGRTVVHGVLERVEAEMRRRGVVTFNDLLDGARRLLEDHPHVAAQERRRMTQLLVDEFQDTDAVQCAIVAQLGLEGDARPALFLVGDPKQSIFAWRNADLGAFHDFEQRIRDAGGRVLELQSNFRSRQAILDEVERVIRPVMHYRHGVQPEFVGLVAERDEARAPAGPAVEYWMSWPRDERTGRVDTHVGRQLGPSNAVEAEAIARDVLARQRAGARWKHFALVFRALTEIEPYLNEMRRLGIPYEVQTDRNYYLRREVVDATALVRAVLDPTDVLALLTLLRSPFVGVPDAAIPALWAEFLPSDLSTLRRPDPDRLARLEEKVRRAAARTPGSVPGLAEVDGWVDSLLYALRSVALVRQAFGREPVDRWVALLRERFLPEVTESARFPGAYRLDNLDRFFRELTRDLEDRGGDAWSVMRTLRANLARTDRSEARRPTDSTVDAVQVLTVHGAKGLEFEHVYLPQTHKQEKLKDDDKTAFERRGDATAWSLFGAAPPAWYRIKERRDRAANAERVRLLYVALTRAKNRLVVLGAHPTRPKQREWHEARRFLDLFPARAGFGDGLSELVRRVEDGVDEPFVDGDGVAWWLSAVLADVEAERAEAEEAAGLPDLASAAAQAGELAAARGPARERMQRPFSSAMSAEAHTEAAERVALERFAEAGVDLPDEPARADSGLDEAAESLGRAAARSIGTAVHAVLEELDLGRDLAVQLEERIGSLEARLAAEVPGEDLAGATERAQDLCRRLADNGLLDRLASLAPQIVARELAVLEAPGADPDAPVGFVSGAIDLVYRDPDTGDLVVADYKTDRVESDADVAERTAAYRGQLQAYAAALRASLGLDRDPRAELWFLHAGRVEVV